MRRLFLFVFFSSFASFLFKASAVISGPVCSILYGQPDPAACQQLLENRNSLDVPAGIAWTDAVTHCFSLASATRPANCTQNQWYERVKLPRFWSNHGCKAALIPQQLSNGEIGVDNDDWRHIANVGSNVRLICMDSALFDGVHTVPLGGYRSAGNNRRLVFVLYASQSIYDQEILADEEAERPVVAVESAEGLPIPADTVNLRVPNSGGRGTVSSENTPAAPTSKGPLCGQSCAGPAHLCYGKDGCICIADAWQGTGSGFFTGTCKIPYSWQRTNGEGSGRGLVEIGFNSTSSSNSTGALPLLAQSLGNLTGMACPCNCTYVSDACCSSVSGIVYETASFKLGVLEPPDSQTFCNTTTGEFQGTS